MVSSGSRRDHTIPRYERRYFSLIPFFTSSLNRNLYCIRLSMYFFIFTLLHLMSFLGSLNRHSIVAYYQTGCNGCKKRLSVLSQGKPVHLGCQIACTVSIINIHYSNTVGAGIDHSKKCRQAMEIRSISYRGRHSDHRSAY